MANENVSELDLLRMVSLYALRYERHSGNDLRGLLQTLAARRGNEHYQKVWNCVSHKAV